MYGGMLKLAAQVIVRARGRTGKGAATRRRLAYLILGFVGSLGSCVVCILVTSLTHVNILINSRVDSLVDKLPDGGSLSRSAVRRCVLVAQRGLMVDRRRWG